MNDTDPATKARVRAFLAESTPQERIAMADRMSIDARRIAAAGARAELGPDASEHDVRRLVFLRFYARDLGRDRAARIFEAIEARRAPAKLPDPSP